MLGRAETWVVGVVNPNSIGQEKGTKKLSYHRYHPNHPYHFIFKNKYRENTG